MVKSRNKIQQIQVIKRRTLRNSSYLARIKRYTKLFLFYLNKPLIDSHSEYLIFILKYLSLISSLLDKAKNLNILSKRTVARKKSKLQHSANFLLKNNE